MYTGPGNWTRYVYNILGQLNSSTYSELGGGKAFAYFKIGDNLTAKCSVRYVYRYYYYSDYTQTPTAHSESRYFTWSNAWLDIEEITGSGTMYNRNNIEDVTVKVYVHGQEYSKSYSWEPGLNNNDITIPDGATSVGDSVFWGLNNSSKRFIETHGILNDAGIIGNIDPPGTGQEGYLLTSGGFLDTESYDSYPAIVIGSGVKSIGYRAFGKSTTGLTGSFIGSVTVNGDVGSIGAEAFLRQRKIAGIDFHEGPTAVGASAFEECNELEYVNFNDNWAYTGNYGTGNLFYNCYKLKRISPSNVIKNLAGNMYRNCNYLTQVTIHDDEIASRVNRQYAFYVDLFAGDPACLDEEGYLITEVNNNSVIDPEVLEIDWKTTWHRIIAYYTEKCLYIFHNGKRLKVRLYSQGTIPVKHEDIWYYLKAVEISQGSPRHNQTPLVIKHKNKWLQVCW